MIKYVKTLLGEFLPYNKGVEKMSKITAKQIKILYSTASSAGLVNNQNHSEDEFHQIIFSLTKKTSAKELTFEEYIKIKKYIEELATENVDGMITLKQKRKIMAMMKELERLSPMENTTIEKRLCGIVEKMLKISSFPQEPLKWVRKKQATKLIQIVGFYIKTEKKKGSAESERG